MIKHLPPTFIRLFTAGALAALVVVSQGHAKTEDPAERIAEIQKTVESLTWRDGAIALEGDLASLKLGPGYRFLDPKDASKVLTKIWNNPPTENLGMFFPEGKGPLEADWAVIIEGFEKEGYVKDSDAGKIEADKLLKKIQEGQREANAARTKQGYGELEIVGWAIPPRYDAEAKKLYWALDIRRVGSNEHSVNYFIRILGRRGFLVVNILGGLAEVEKIQAAAPELLGMIEFKDGHRYADFNSSTDKVASYGLAGLILGGVGLKVAAKLGFLALFLKKFGVIFLALKKLWLLIVVALIGVFKKIKAALTGEKPAVKEIGS